LNGCRRLLVEPSKLNEDGEKINGVWYDDIQLELVEKNALDVSDAVVPTGGPARSSPPARDPK
jgi:hypothetical protein